MPLNFQGFVSPGALAQQAIQKLLVQRAMEERQAQLDAEARQERLAAQKHREDQLALQRQQQENMVNQFRQQQALSERQFSAQQGANLASILPTGAEISGETRRKFADAGLSDLVPWNPPAILEGPLQEGEERVAVPGAFRLGETGARQAARETREAQAAREQAQDAFLAEQNRLNREFQATSREDTQAFQAGQNALARAATLAAKAPTAEELAASQGATQDAYNFAARLEEMPGIDEATGAWETRRYWQQKAIDFDAQRDQLVAALTMPNLGLMKGVLSETDMKILQNLSTRLRNKQLSKDETLRAIREAKAFLLRKGADAGKYVPDEGTPTPRATGTPGTATAPRRRTYNMRGEPVS